MEVPWAVSWSKKGRAKFWRVLELKVSVRVVLDLQVMGLP